VSTVHLDDASIEAVDRAAVHYGRPRRALSA
jgi:hypothetical protein